MLSWLPVKLLFDFQLVHRSEPTSSPLDLYCWGEKFKATGCCLKGSLVVTRLAETTFPGGPNESFVLARTAYIQNKS